MTMLRSIREKKGLTVSQLASRAGISSKVLTDYEGGVQVMPLNHARLLAKALWVSIEDLMPPAGSTPPAPPAPTPAVPTPTPAPAVRQATPNAATTAPPQPSGPDTTEARAATEQMPPRPEAARRPGPEGEAAGALPPRKPRRAEPLSEGQTHEILGLAARMEIDPQQLEARLGKPVGTLGRAEAREWIKKLRAIADEIAPRSKGRYGLWPGTREDREATYLREQQDAQAHLSFKLFNGEQFAGAILDFTPYTITIKEDAGDEVVLRKLAIAYYRVSPGAAEAGAVDAGAVDLAGTPTDIDSDRPGAPAVPEKDNMDEDRGI